MFRLSASSDSSQPKVFSNCPKVSVIAIALITIGLLALALGVPAVGRFMTASGNIPNWAILLMIAMAAMIGTALYTVARSEVLKQQKKADAEQARKNATASGDKLVKKADLDAAIAAKNKAEHDHAATKAEFERLRLEHGTVSATAHAHATTIAAKNEEIAGLRQQYHTISLLHSGMQPQHGAVIPATGDPEGHAQRRHSGSHASSSSSSTSSTAPSHPVPPPGLRPALPVTHVAFPAPSAAAAVGTTAAPPTQPAAEPAHTNTAAAPPHAEEPPPAQPTTGAAPPAQPTTTAQPAPAPTQTNTSKPTHQPKTSGTGIMGGLKALLHRL